MRMSPEGLTDVACERSLTHRPGDTPRAPSDLNPNRHSRGLREEKTLWYQGLTEKTCLSSTFAVSYVWQEVSARGAWQMQKRCGAPGHQTPSRPHLTEMLRIWDAQGPRGGLPVGAQCPESETPALASAPPPPHEASALHQEPALPLSRGPSPGCRLPAAGRAQRPPCLQKWLPWVQAESCRGLTIAPRDTTFLALERGLQGHAASSSVVPRPASPGCLSSELSRVLLRPCTPDRGPRGPWTVRTGAGGQRVSSLGSSSSTAPSRPPAHMLWDGRCSCLTRPLGPWATRSLSACSQGTEFHLPSPRQQRPFHPSLCIGAKSGSRGRAGPGVAAQSSPLAGQASAPLG